MKRRIIALAIAPLAIAVIALAVVSAGRTEARQTPPPTAPALTADQTCSDAGAANGECGYPVYECFWVLESHGEGSVPDEAVTLTTDNFGPDDVIVKKLVWLCESGYKFRDMERPNGPAAATVGQVYACYSLIRGASIYRPATLYTDNFGADRVLVRNSQFMCEQAQKTHNGTVTGTLDDGAGATSDHSNVWQCFNLSALLRLRTFGIWTSNFDWQRILTLNGFQLCEDAEKRHGEYIGGTANGAVRECFRVEQMFPFWQPEWVMLQTENFGQVHALIGRPAMMCENAEKQLG